MAAVPAGSTTGAASRPARNLLVVDDIPDIVSFFAAVVGRLRDFQVRLTTETDSAKALGLVRERDFDLVISDFRMRDVDGVEVLSAARARNPHGHRILMTGYNEIPTDLARIRQAGVDAYIQKPLSTQDLLLMMLDFLHGNPAAIEACRRHARELELMGGRPDAHAPI